MTIEGEIAGLGEFARGAARRGGPAGVLARAVVLCLLVPFVAVIVARLVGLIS